LLSCAVELSDVVSLPRLQPGAAAGAALNAAGANETDPARPRGPVPCHPSLEEYLNVWIIAAGIGREKKSPLFRSVGRGNRLSQCAMSRFDVIHMIKRRAEAAALPFVSLPLCDLSGSGRGRPPLPEVFKTVSSDWVAMPGHERKGPHSRLGPRARIAQGWAAALEQ
jgi:hypothetical protein